MKSVGRTIIQGTAGVENLKSFSYIMTIAALILGMSVGFFMYAFVNHRFNKTSWIDSRYVFWIGVLVLCVSLVLFYKASS